MHVEKNVCDSLIGTLLNMQGKTKDGVNARLDLDEMKIREDLAPREVGRRTYLPPACYTMSRQEKISFCLCLKSVKVPQGYSSNIQSLVSMQDLKLVGLKCHDCHILMQQLLPIATSYLPSACYTMSRQEKISFCLCLKSVKVPQGYSSNIQSLVSMQDLKLVGLKSHDFHILMQQLLPMDMAR